MPKFLAYDLAILAGDIVASGRVAARWLRNPVRFGAKPIVQIAGNHEYYESVVDEELAEMHRQAKAHDINFLDCDEFVIEGMRFLALHPVDRLRRADRRPGLCGATDAPVVGPAPVDGSVRALPGRVRRHPHGRPVHVQFGPHAALSPDRHPADPPGASRLAARQACEPFDGPTVVVTHHVPHRQSLALRIAEDWASGGFVSEMPAEFFDVPVLWVHGRTHDSFDYDVRGCLVVCNPRGYKNWHSEFENKGSMPGACSSCEQCRISDEGEC